MPMVETTTERVYSSFLRKTTLGGNDMIILLKHLQSVCAGTTMS